MKNFLPRLNESIISLKISRERKYLLSYLSNNTIKIVLLSEMKIINEISSLPQESIISKFNLFSLSSNFLTFHKKESGLIQFYHLGQNNFPFYLNILNKNFISKTENEEQNLKHLEFITFSSSQDKKDENYMLSIEEINYSENNLITYLKFWKVTKDNIYLLCSTENSHLNEKIFYAQGNNSNSFITCSKSYFKKWEIQKDGKYICTYIGKYKNKQLIHATFSNDKIIYALFDKYLIKFENNKIKKIYFLEVNENISKYNLISINKGNLICLYNKNHLIVFDTQKWNIAWEEKITLGEINKVIENEEKINVFIKGNNNMIYLIKFNALKEKEIIDEAMIIEKKNIKFVDFFTKYLIVINEKNDIFYAGKEEINNSKKITKEEMDNNDIEI